MKLLLDCRTVSRLISRSQDHAPPPPVLQVRMRLHLATCRACRDVDDQMRFVRTAMRSLPAVARRLHPSRDPQ
jgi:predicted anti-sigma-YlaC factor YlaD